MLPSAVSTTSTSNTWKDQIDQALEFFLTDYLAESWGEGGKEGEPPKFEDLKIATRIANWPIEQTVVTHGIVRTEPSEEEE